jgi:sortase (surface protein transpeptidase)
VPSRLRPRRPVLAAAPAVAALAALALALGGCTGAVDNPEDPNPPSATLPLRGPQRPEVGLPHAPEPGGGLAPASGPTAAAGSAAGSFDVPGVPPRAPGFEVGDLPGRPAAPGSGSPPVRLAIPAIGVATPLVRLGLEADGGMQVPADFGRAGWFTEGPAPGQVGPSVIAGHVDSRTGPAVFYRLRELRPGQAILVERADGSRLRFVVEQARSYPKEEFPTAAVFGPVPEAALRLITCAGDFDRARGSYRDNLVVFARLAGQVGTDAGNRG